MFKVWGAANRGNVTIDKDAIAYFCAASETRGKNRHRR